MAQQTIDSIAPVRCPSDHTVLAYVDSSDIKLTCPKCCKLYRHPEKETNIMKTVHSAIIGIALLAAAFTGGHTAHAQTPDSGAYAAPQQAGTWQREVSSTPTGYEDIFYPAPRTPDAALRYDDTQPQAGPLAVDPYELPTFTAPATLHRATGVELKGHRHGKGSCPKCGHHRGK